MSSSYRVAAGGVIYVGLSVFVWGNAVGADYFCLGHPQSLSCDSPAAPLPQMPDESITSFTAGSSVVLINTIIPAFVIAPSSGS